MGFTFGQGMKTRLTAVGVTANPGDLVVPTASLTVTLPATPLVDTRITVLVGYAATATSAVTVTRSGTPQIYGGGTGVVNSITLGIQGASVVLQFDGTLWGIVSGQQDTGWVALTLATNVVTGGGYNPPAARLQGDTVRLKGILQNNTGGNIGGGTSWATVPAGLRPTALVIAPNGSATISPTYTRVDTSGLLSVGITFSNGTFFGIDGITYSIS